MVLRAVPGRGAARRDLSAREDRWVIAATIGYRLWGLYHNLAAAITRHGRTFLLVQSLFSRLDAIAAIPRMPRLLVPKAPAPLVTLEETDGSLVRRVQRGDKTAFDLLVRKYQHKVVKLVMRYVGNQAEAEDVAQEAFIKAYRALANFRGDSAFYTWLYRIAINTAKNTIGSRDRRTLPIEGGDDDEGSYDLQDRLQDNATPEALAMTDEIRDTVNQAIAALPEDLRTAIVLRELEGLSYEDIAATMSCPVGTVRSRIFRAREAIDARLREVFEGGLGRSEEVG